MGCVYYIECGVKVFAAWKGDRGEALGGSCLDAFLQQRLEHNLLIGLQRPARSDPCSRSNSAGFCLQIRHGNFLKKAHDTSTPALVTASRPAIFQLHFLSTCIHSRYRLLKHSRHYGSHQGSEFIPPGNPAIWAPLKQSFLYHQTACALSPFEAY